MAISMAKAFSKQRAGQEPPLPRYLHIIFLVFTAMSTGKTAYPHRGRFHHLLRWRHRSCFANRFWAAVLARVVECDPGSWRANGRTVHDLFGPFQPLFAELEGCLRKFAQVVHVRHHRPGSGHIAIASAAGENFVMGLAN